MIILLISASAQRSAKKRRSKTSKSILGLTYNQFDAVRLDCVKMGPDSRNVITSDEELTDDIDALV